MTTHNTEPPVYRVEEVSEMLGMGLNQTYRAIARGELPSIKIGRRILIPRQRLIDKLNGGGPDATK
jgi:excisionase family DNA binding protein